MLRSRNVVDIRQLLCGFACCGLGMTAGAFGQTPPTVFPLHSVVRDFHKTDAKIAVAAVGGNGHYAGNLMPLLSSDQRPMFIGGGHKVLVQWRDQDNHAIAPNMYINPDDAGGSVPVVDAPSISNNPQVDTYDPSMGPYGAGNIGPAPEFVAGSTMPSIAMPAGMGPSAGAVEYRGNGVTTLSQDMHCDSFALRNRRTLRIAGNITIACEGDFTIENHTRVEILDGASLKVYAQGQMTIDNNVDVNMNTFESARLSLYNCGPTAFRVANSARVCGRLVSPGAAIDVGNNCDFYGRFMGKTALISNSGGFHIESGISICGREPNDTTGVYGLLSAGGIPSAAAFATWYSDVPGTNLSMPHTMNLTRDSSGAVWQFLSNGFHPIDGSLFGNESQGHNNYFTYVATVRFRHHACTGGFFEFSGNDDAWLFVNNELAMDRGGVLPGTIPQYVEIDRMHLVDGQVYTLKFFHAQRNALQSIFRLRTNLDLIDEPVQPIITAPVD